jgi:alpha-amylase
VFDDYDLGSKKQKGTIPIRYGRREELQRYAAMMRANGIEVSVDLVENQRDGDDGKLNFKYLDAFGGLGAWMCTL